MYNNDTKDKILCVCVCVCVCIYIYIYIYTHTNANCWLYNRNGKTPRALSTAKISVLSCVIKWTRCADTGSI